MEKISVQGKGKQFKNLEDVLTEGIHIIELSPKKEYSESEGRYLDNTHLTGEVKRGKNIGKVFWKYSTNVPYKAVIDGVEREIHCGVNAFSPTDKKIFDQGKVKCEVRKIEWFVGIDGVKYYNVGDAAEKGIDLILDGKEPRKFSKIVANIHPMDWEPKTFNKSGNLPKGVKLMTPQDIKEDLPTINVDEIGEEYQGDINEDIQL